MFDIYIQQAFLVILLCSGLPLVCSSLCGLCVALVQAATQIQEQTVTYLVKFLSVCSFIAIFSEWLISKFLTFAEEVFFELSVSWADVVKKKQTCFFFTIRRSLATTVALAKVGSEGGFADLLKRGNKK